ncbi:MAG: AlpA family phage regulatory protein [Acidobacteria bacterium]|nr:AlpA family phage regulatory protein [Acidobacteriota bacterium]
MDTQATTPTAASERKRPIKTPLKYDPASEIVRGEHFDRATGLSNTTIWRYRKADKFVPILRLGDNAIGARRADINEWLASREAR